MKAYRGGVPEEGEQREAEEREDVKSEDVKVEEKENRRKGGIREEIRMRMWGRRRCGGVERQEDGDHGKRRSSR